MAEYIEREAVINHLRECEGTPPEIGYTYPIFKAIECFVENLSAADVVEVVRCGECIHNYGIKANCKFNPHDIICDYWSTDGMDEKDFCSKGSREDVGYEFVDKTKETCSCGEEVEVQIRSNGEYVFSQAYCHSCGLASAWWDEKTEDVIGRARKSYRKSLEERAAKMAQNIR